jgi:hypothetical protein
MNAAELLALRERLLKRAKAKSARFAMLGGSAKQHPAAMFAKGEAKALRDSAAILLAAAKKL